MAMSVPRATSHQGAVAGMSMPSRSPVTAALPSPIGADFFKIRLQMNSQIMAQAMEKDITARAGAPYWLMPISTAGSAAIIML